MTRIIKLAGLLLIVTLSATGCNYVHRNIRGMMQHSGMRMCNKNMDFRQMRRMRYGNFNPGDRDMFHGRMRGMNRNDNDWQRPMPGFRDKMAGDYGMRRGMGQMGPGHMRIDRIPNLTDKQRKEIADLRQKQMAEMDKLREETFAKMQSLRETNRSNMMNLLTDEQKKFLESAPFGSGQTPPPVTK